MKELVECFIAWLAAEPTGTNAWKILNALAGETRQRVESSDPEQREFDAAWIAEVCKPGESLIYDNAKGWFASANPGKYLTARRKSLESFFVAQGHSQCLQLAKRGSNGGNRTTWFLQPYGLVETQTAEVNDKPVTAETATEWADILSVTYAVTRPGEIGLSWFGRLVLGNGAFRTRSWRGGLWAAGMIFSAFGLIACGLIIFQMRTFTRAIQTSDLVAISLFALFAWIIWRRQLRPLVWLLEDRIAIASDSLVKLKEETAHLDMAKDGDHRYIRLVRYKAVCPICAGNIELRYGHGANNRRIFGCCTEVPTEHVFTFDRVTKQGQRYEQ